METYDYLLKEWPKDIDYIMALDESGTSEIKSIKRNLLRNNEQPVWFVLSGIIFDLHTMINVKEKIIGLKNKYWPKDGMCYGKKVVLHSKEMRHRDNAFSKKYIKNYDAFLNDLCQIICDSSIKAISICINKTAHVKKYTNPYPIYEYALALMLERYSFNVKNNEKGILLFESRNGGADKQLLRSAANTFKKGTYYIPGSNFSSVSHGIYFNPKRTSDDHLSYFMLEFADLMAYAVYRKLSFNVESKIYKCMEKKIIGYPHFNGRGLKIIDNDGE